MEVDEEEAVVEALDDDAFTLSGIGWVSALLGLCCCCMRCLLGLLALAALLALLGCLT